MSTINTILIANRGEIASRVIRTCKKMGIRSIAIHSPIDENLPFFHEADLAVKIGDNTPQTSYLNQDLIIKTAKEIGADAIHPGYGFLSENADFAELCAKNNIPCHQKNFSLYDTYSADEAFVTGTFGGLTPVTSIDGKIIENQNNKSLRENLNRLYEELIANESKF